ncbi:hypothetical protein SK128_023350, partial [Halocaridina rubra]
MLAWAKDKEKVPSPICTIHPLDAANNLLDTKQRYVKIPEDGMEHYSVSTAFGSLPPDFFSELTPQTFHTP